VIVVKYSLTINTVKENIHKNLLFLVNTEFFNPKSFPILTLKITPQTVLFNDEDFHSVKILKTVVRQSDVLAHRKKWLF
jgi:hypothetical protein